MIHHADRDQQTICAVSTPPGYGGIAVIRVSGLRALELTKKIAPGLPKSLESHHVYFTTIVSENKSHIDEVLITYFQNGKSFYIRSRMTHSFKIAPGMDLLRPQAFISEEQGKYIYQIL